MRIRDPAKSWSSAFLFVRNDWGLLKKWGKMRDLPAPLHVREEDKMRLLKVPDIEHLLYKVCYLNKYIEEEFLFKVGLSLHPRRSDARMLKPTSKVPEPPAPVPKVAPKRQVGGEDPHVLLKKKKLEGVAASTSKVQPTSSPVKFRVPGDVLSHQCIGRRKANDLLSRRTELEAKLAEALNEWNTESVKIKYLQGEYKWKYDHKIREAKVLEEELCGCRTEMLRENQRASVEKVTVLEAENKRSQTLTAEKEVALTSFESSRVMEDFKKSIAFKIIIQDYVQEARDHIYERKTEVEVEGLTPSQASDDFPPGSDGDEIESKLQKVFALEADDEVVDIE
ncbi:hypothetical protein IEQ34_021250 [Dendrobium chrysotoxum]|uniref:Uncharacterized protein n=1 Tax=Dendrobium chrysotoxum TaxID=161865 RepID=A0AAV7G5D4_DENCH|nr:hypothetical protein IEQ34_021250 [Dendrobium chrysotoxum]